MSLSDIRVRATLKGTIFRGGGGGGVTSYNQLNDKPSINGVTIEGALDGNDHGLANTSDLIITGYNTVPGESIYRLHDVTIDGRNYTVAYLPFEGTDGIDNGKVGLVPAPTAADASKVLFGDGTWKNIPDVNDISSMTWTLLISQVGGTVSNYTSIGSSKYLIIYADYQGVSYIPKIYKVSDLNKIINVSGNNEIAEGYNWKVNGSFDEWEFHYKSDQTCAVKATYNGITMKVYGVQ